MQGNEPGYAWMILNGMQASSIVELCFVLSSARMPSQDQSSYGHARPGCLSSFVFSKYLLVISVHVTDIRDLDCFYMLLITGILVGEY